MKLFSVPATLVLLVVAKVEAQEFQGADAALQKLATAAAKPLEERKADPGSELFFKFKGFQKDSATMPPEQAATQWLAMYDAFIATPHTILRGQSRTGEHWLTTREVLSSLPPPAAWPFLADALKNRQSADNVMRASAERVLGLVLTDDKAGLKREAANLKKESEKIEPDYRWRFEVATKTLESIANPLSAAESVVAQVEERIAYVERGSRDKDFDMPEEADFDISDLVMIAGESKATQLLGRIIPLAYGLRIEGKATRRLAAKLALTNVDHLHVPFWDLVETLEDIPLYEALVRRFGNVDGYYRVEADTVYLVHLIAEGRSKDAAKFGSELAKRERIDEFSLTGHELEVMQQQGLGKRVLGLLQEMLASDPSLPYWHSYMELSADEGSSKEALEFLRVAMARPDVSAHVRELMQRLYYKGMLAAGEVEEGVKTLRDIIKAGLRSVALKGTEADAPPQLQAPEEIDDALEHHMKLSLELARLGILLQKKEWIDEGFAAARDSYCRLTMSARFGNAETIAFYLIDAGRLAEAEAIVVARLEELVRPDPSRDRFNDHREQVDCLAMLANIYLIGGRPQDVILLLDRSPHWRAPDLASLSNIRGGRKSLQLIAAQAFARVGRKEEAAELALRVLMNAPGTDAAYDVLLTVGAENLEDLMKELSRRRRFEERPLIWMAKLQLGDGRLDEAERTIRAAIAIDPSDGEQGKGDRLRAYAVLGEILEKKGDVAQAKIMRDAVASIRLAEDADDWWGAGLQSQARGMYEKALHIFADAYCIQSRVALSYAEKGDFEKAEHHYRRAYELMPESFGRVESHCLGCEGVFSGERAQNIADKVFTSLAGKKPERAQVFYMLGHLREGQERNIEAVESYWRAVKVDPDYLNAWKRLSELASEVVMPVGQYEEISLALLRLDPLGGSFSASSVVDLGKFWMALLAAEHSQPEEEIGPIYPLAASTPEFDRLSEESAQNLASPQRREDLRTKLLDHPSIALVARMLEFAQ